MNNEWAFLPMRSSNDLLDDPAALHDRLATESYLYFEQVLDVDKLGTIRDDITQILYRHGMIRGGEQRMRAVSISAPVREGDDGYFAVHDEIQKLESFHTMAHDPGLVSVMRSAMGETAFPHPLKVVRLAFPGNYEISTPPHQDYPNNQGTPNLTASWVPLSDISTSLGGLAVLRGSSSYGVLPLARHLGPGNRCAVLPPEMVEECRWVTTDFALGDVLLFPSTAVHASLHNASDILMRLSIDFRWQLEGEALTPIVLEPHFGRLGWEEIYAGWGSDEFQYYWRDLNYEVVPFEEFELIGEGPDDYDEGMRESVRYDRAMRRRHEAKMAMLGESSTDVDS